MSRLKEIFSNKPEIMSTLVKWVFALPLAYVVYIVLSLLIPNLNISANAVILTQFFRTLLLVLCVLSSVKYFLKFNLKKFFSESEKWNTGLFFKGIYLMAVALTVTNICLALIFPESITSNPNKSSLLTNWVCSFLLVAISAFSEEIIFRAYVAWFAKTPSDGVLCNDSNKALIYALVSSLLFSIAHFSNPEVNQSAIWSMLFYFIFGFCLMLFFLKTKGIEFGLGVHFANNIFSAWFINYNGSVLPTQSLFINTVPIGFITIMQAIICLAFCAIMCPDMRKDK